MSRTHLPSAMRGKPFALFASILILICISVAFGASRAWRTTNADSTANGKKSAPSTVGQQTPRAHATTEAELITLEPYGFTPAQLTLKKGHFLIYVENRSNTETITLHLARVNPVGQIIALLREVTVRLRAQNPDWTEELNLEPGEYVLSEAAHPKWLCKITVTP
jgi:hypothetical protein